MANNPVVGAWERVPDSNVGIRIYTGSHYAMLGAPKDRKRLQAIKPRQMKRSRP